MQMTEYLQKFRQDLILLFSFRATKLYQ